MTTGQLLFYGGAALLGLTIVLAIVFLFVKPKYKPEVEDYRAGEPGKTQSLLNGYPTDRMTVRRESAKPTEPVTSKGEQETEMMSDDLTILMAEDEGSDV
ncbi:MAG: hypothetical protein OSJ58_10310 [Dysosmobacter sp.]|nr:hypothetical protein [Dysosmobacter sp.]